MLKIFNTLTRKLEEFKPIDEGKIRFYQCGPTVYSRQHIGNLSSAVRGDLIRRSLEYLGYEVKFVRNITDVGHLSGDNEGDADIGEDRMAKGAKKEGLKPEAIATKYTGLYHQDIEKLNVKPPTLETVATHYVDQMAGLVQDLIDRGYAYSTEKAIYFEVDKFPTYNDLNRQKLEENRQGAGHGSEADAEKKKPYDFAVWFFKTGVHENALQTWEKEFKGIVQPTKAGFPGWHIECSAMARDSLGDTIDLHMGGVEHIPIHHTNEIAQSEAANEKRFTNYWLHHELLLIDGGKMSKSIGNVYSIDDLEEKGFHARDYRYFLLQAHYRSKQNFTWEALEASRSARKNLIKQLVKLVISKIPEVVNVDEIEDLNVNPEYKSQFVAHLENDFNVPGALSIVWDVLKSDLSDDEKLGTIFDFDRVLGLSLKELMNKALNSSTPGSDLPVEVSELIEKRRLARSDKNWQKSDELREMIESMGYEVKDSGDGQVISKIN
jgi:cysteinyl-tRNA synthetase